MKPKATTSFNEDEIGPDTDSVVEKTHSKHLQPKKIHDDDNSHSRHSSTGREKLITRKDTQKKGKGASCFQVIGILRVLFTSAYSFYIAYQGFLNPEYVKIGATPVFVASMIALSLDVVFVVLRACPSLMAKCKPAQHYNPILSTGVWLLILDQELIMDLLTPLMNLYLSIYKFRLAELVIFNSTADGLQSAPEITSYKSLADPKTSNFILLMILGLTLVIMINYHSFRICGILAKKKAVTLGLIVVIKGFLLMCDLLINGFFLYQSLVTKGFDIFVYDRTMIFVLSVVIPSPWITLVANSLINFPMHYFYLRMKRRLALSIQPMIDSKGEAGGNHEEIQKKEDAEIGLDGKNDEENNVDSTPPPRTKSKELLWKHRNTLKKNIKELSNSSIARLAAERTWNVFICFFFNGYAIYSVIAMFYIMSSIRSFSPTSSVSGSGLPVSSGSFSGPDLVIALVWINVFANYGIGVLSAILFWLYEIFYILFKIAKAFF